MKEIKRKCKKGLYEVLMGSKYLFLSYHDDIFVHTIVIDSNINDKILQAFENEDWKYFEDLDKYILSEKHKKEIKRVYKPGIGLYFAKLKQDYLYLYHEKQVDALVIQVNTQIQQAFKEKNWDYFEKIYEQKIEAKDERD